MATENSAHAPGTDIMRGGKGGPVRQRAMMGSGKGVMGAETFGVGKLPGSAFTPMARGAAHDGALLADHQRSNPPGINMGDGSMDATRHSHHGPHGHEHGMHRAAEKPAPHHVKGMEKGAKGGRGGY